MLNRSPAKRHQFVSLFRDLVAHRGRDAAIVFLKAVEHLTEEDVAAVIKEADDGGGAPSPPDRDHTA